MDNTWLWPSSTSAVERGKMAEENFFTAWQDAAHFPNWIVSIERPTPHEDFSQKTDAVIVRITGPNLRIQIKSYWLSLEDTARLIEYGVIPLCIIESDTPAKIRMKTHKAIERFYFHNEQVELGIKLPRLKKNGRQKWYQYRHGKRYLVKRRKMSLLKAR
jgi:hypothetical protein